MLSDLKKNCENLLRDKTVLITGGMGAIGFQIARRLVTQCSPKKIRLFQNKKDRKISSSDQDFLDRNGDRIEVKNGNILNKYDLNEAVQDIQIAFHAAALSGVQKCENEPIRAIRINLESSLALIDALDRHHCQKGVFLSSVRASTPVNVYAMTKNLMERFVSKHPQAQTTFVAVRLGLVVWPIVGNVFQAWADTMARKEPLKVLDAGKCRYLLSMNAAIDSIFYALVAGDHGDIIVPKMAASDMESLAAVFTENSSNTVRYEVPNIESLYPNPDDQILSNDELPFTRERNQCPDVGFYHVNRQQASGEKVIPLEPKDHTISGVRLRELLADARLLQTQN